MKSIAITLAALTLLSWHATANAQQAKTSFLPLPKSVQLAPGKVTLSGRITTADASLLPLANVLAQEIASATGHKVETAQGAPKAGDIVLQIDATRKGESYNLAVADQAIVIGGNYQAVALGTVTLLQGLAEEGGKLALAKGTVLDSPDVGYRGLMIDVARNFHSPATLKEIIQLCRLYKIRYLQLHLSDDQAFTFPSAKYPTLATPDRSYTLEQIKDLVAYGDARGVTLVPEIDLPAHATALCKAMPEFASPSGGIVNFSSDKTVQALGDILDEVAAIFASSPYIHLGADEANIGGLAADPQFQQAMQANKIDNIGGLFNHFLNQMNARVKARGKAAIAWEGFGVEQGPSQLDKDIIVMPFDNYKNAQTYYIQGGHRVINTSWYPMYVVGQQPLTELIYGWDVYTFGNYTDPFPRRYTSIRQYQVTSKDKVLGAQMCSWEQPQETEIPQLRHALAAMAERSWNRVAKDYSDFQRRLALTDKILQNLLTSAAPDAVNATASDSIYPDGVVVRWQPGNNYPVKYTVLRAATDDIAAAKPIAVDIPQTQILDKQAAKGATYYYWVKAGNRMGYSVPGQSAKGAIGSTTKLPQAYEGFDYPASASIDGQNGGTGWQDQWKLAVAGPVTLKDAGLTYKNLRTVGRCLNVRYTDKDNTSIELVRNTAVPMGTPGSDFWVSFLLRGNKVAEGHCFLEITSAGYSALGKSWGNGLGICGNCTAYPLQPGKTAFIVAHFTCFNGKDIIRMWVDPSLDKQPSPLAPDMGYRDNVDIGVQTRIRFNVQYHGQGDYDIDEIRIGRSWPEVAPKTDAKK